VERATDVATFGRELPRAGTAVLACAARLPSLLLHSVAGHAAALVSRLKLPGDLAPGPDGQSAARWSLHNVYAVVQLRAGPVLDVRGGAIGHFGTRRARPVLGVGDGANHVGDCVPALVARRDHCIVRADPRRHEEGASQSRNPPALAAPGASQRLRARVHGRDVALRPSARVGALPDNDSFRDHLSRFRVVSARETWRLRLFFSGPNIQLVAACLRAASGGHHGLLCR